MKNGIWNDFDIVKAVLYGTAIGFIIGVAIGYAWAWQPVVKAFKPLIG